MELPKDLNFLILSKLPESDVEKISDHQFWKFKLLRILPDIPRPIPENCSQETYFKTLFHNDMVVIGSEKYFSPKSCLIKSIKMRNLHKFDYFLRVTPKHKLNRAFELSTEIGNLEMNSKIIKRIDTFLSDDQLLYRAFYFEISTMNIITERLIALKRGEPVDLTQFFNICRATGTILITYFMVLIDKPEIHRFLTRSNIYYPPFIYFAICGYIRLGNLELFKKFIEAYQPIQLGMGCNLKLITKTIIESEDLDIIKYVLDTLNGIELILCQRILSKSHKSKAFQYVYENYSHRLTRDIITACIRKKKDDPEGLEMLRRLLN